MFLRSDRSGSGGGGPPPDLSGLVPYTGGAGDVRLAHQFVSTDGISSISRSGGKVSGISYVSGYAITFSRDLDGKVVSWTDGTNTWTVNRSGGVVTGITVS